MFVDYTTDVIGASAFGVKSDATLTGGGPLRDITRELTTFSLYRGIQWGSIFLFPELVDIFRFKLFPRSSIVYFEKIFRSMVAQRKANESYTEPRDLLDLLIKIQEENKSYTDELIISQAAIFLLGGFETSATNMTFILYELAYNQDVQEKLYQELAEAAERNGSEDFDIKVLSDLTYLECVFKEGLRKYTTMGWLDRIAMNDYKVDDKLTIEAGTVVYINSTGMHYDPKYFPDPHKFDPDRFLPENKDKIVPHSYLPFGEGPRFCVGKRFALTTVYFGLASILLNYKLRPCPNMPRPSDIKIDYRGILYLPGETLNVEFIPRK
ncbi:cytochrome P450 3A19-like isoform X2 [Melitaea cinxia]|uniref:cytochrome P450 3A19-like isoform X2 n=1 Tax=Melitaea cinxia TaxID=113334 RepID=UPI001E273B08|nr:cytochrome P450 3A19-like isoform X2 [Melitaea cinxia]